MPEKYAQSWADTVDTVPEPQRGCPKLAQGANPG